MATANRQDEFDSRLFDFPNYIVIAFYCQLTTVNPTNL